GVGGARAGVVAPAADPRPVGPAIPVAAPGLVEDDRTAGDGQCRGGVGVDPAPQSVAAAAAGAPVAAEGPVVVDQGVADHGRARPPERGAEAADGDAATQ